MRTAETLTIPLLSDSLVNKQISLEHYAVSEGVERYNKNKRKAIKRGEASSLKPVERMLLYWWWPLVEAIRREQRLCRRGDSANNRNWYGPLFLALDAERLSFLAISETLNQTIAHHSGVKYTPLCYAIGRYD